MRSLITPEKMLSVFALVCLFLASSAVVSVNAIVVAPNECPQYPAPSWIASCDVLTRQCVRTDSGVISVSEGTPDTVTGGSSDCVNCATNCPDFVPPPMHCIQTLEVTFSETATASLALGVSASMGIDVFGVEVTVKDTLENSIGHSSERSKTFSQACGSSSVPGCEKASYAIKLSVMTGVTMKMEHEYKWKTTMTHNPSVVCTVPDHASYSYPLITYEFSGTRISTATGSSYGAAGCFFVSSSPCP